MTTTIENRLDQDGRIIGTMRVIRDDAVRHNGRYIVPTTEKTRWVSTWEEFRAAKGNICWNEDATEMELLLPEPYKFSIQFMFEKE